MQPGYYPTWGPGQCLWLHLNLKLSHLKLSHWTIIGIIICLLLQRMAPTGPGPFWSPPSGGGSAASTGGAGSVRSLADISTYDEGREDGSFLAGGVGGLHWEVGRLVML